MCEGLVVSHQKLLRLVVLLVSVSIEFKSDTKHEKILCRITYETKIYDDRLLKVCFPYYDICVQQQVLESIAVCDTHDDVIMFATSCLQHRGKLQNN